MAYFTTLAMQHGGLWIETGMMPANSKAATRNDVNWIGAASGAFAATPSDAGVDAMLPGDLETARQFGARVGDAAARWSTAQ